MQVAQQKSSGNLVVIVPNFFHIAIDGEMTCGTTRQVFEQPDGEYCRRCQLKYEESNEHLASELGLRYSDITLEDMVIINEILGTNPGLSGKNLVRETCLEHIKCIPRPIDQACVKALNARCVG